jgi:hypothetical protein
MQRDAAAETQSIDSLQQAKATVPSGKSRSYARWAVREPDKVVV